MQDQRENEDREGFMFHTAQNAPYGDPYRYLSLVPGMPVSPLPYCWILDGRNKKSVALDLNDHGARQALLAIIRSADVFITNYQGPPGQKFRVAYQDRKSTRLNS